MNHFSVCSFNFSFVRKDWFIYFIYFYFNFLGWHNLYLYQLVKTITILTILCENGNKTSNSYITILKKFSMAYLNATNDLKENVSRKANLTRRKWRIWIGLSLSSTCIGMFLTLDIQQYAKANNLD